MPPRTLSLKGVAVRRILALAVAIIAAVALAASAHAATPTPTMEPELRVFPYRSEFSGAGSRVRRHARDIHT